MPAADLDLQIADALSALVRARTRAREAEEHNERPLQPHLTRARLAERELKRLQEQRRALDETLERERAPWATRKAGR